MTRQELIEQLNEVDRTCIDEDLHFYDLKSLYEAKERDLSFDDIQEIKKVVSSTKDPTIIHAAISAKEMENESLEDDFEGGSAALSKEQIKEAVNKYSDVLKWLEDK